MKNEQEVFIYAEGNKLAGSLVIPEENNGNAVLVIAGSGQVDRHGNSAKLPMNVYKELCDQLNKDGIITLCFDKRGVGSSEGNYLKSGVWDFIHDARHWLNYLQNHSLVKRVIVIGHSEGAINGPAIIKDKNVDGFVFMCGYFGEGKELLDYQNQKIKEEITKVTGVKGFIYRLLKVNKKIEKQTEKFYDILNSSSEDVIKYKGKKINAKWLREMQNYKITDFIQDVSTRSLAIEGKKDIQVKQGSANEFASHTGGQVKIYNDMNHLLKKRAQQHSLLNLKKEYKESITNDKIHPEMIKDLILFINHP